MFLEKELFSKVIESTPLVSIDLVVKNNLGQTLLGQRLNKPAKGFWFVPGGRILKNESLATAFKRLTLEELGEEFNIVQGRLLGPYDHFYDDNVFGDDFSTHYVAIAYVLLIDHELNHLPVDIQHGTYQWFDIASLSNNDEVHINTQNYY
ncbi:GDP-mannose mannosyl hydrolase [Paraglaciecola psychrophila]|uniref:GDP-mannose mannosyl hydrolase n=1 Tax=Paraglaciecola psychrophila 170 TaxID=1129794 RepID=K7AUH2_9ALTE|nr:GDP-mannose mannosyl hydrolase [Paraglaciecola psychrophila]AGH43142.1 GDP-mannose mannosyl hydrolase [Paraglaciecola psychrophila 170]GAC38825.1 GDP-mannose mannosyl hydrolase [Paraglaciecola psychrophila 170]